MTETTSFSLLSLPSELQREVFLLAADNGPSDARNLVLVARRVKNWVEPRLYRLVTLGASDVQLFLRTTESKPPNFLALHVKHLCLTASLRVSHARDILTACTGVVNLALWVDFLDTGGLPRGSVAPLISTFPLRRLSIEYKHLLDAYDVPSHTPPAWYRTLTHLDLIFWSPEEPLSLPPFDRLDCLTHLSLGLRHAFVNEDQLASILASSRRLKILLVFFDEMAQKDEFPEPIDDRVVYMAYPMNIVQDWEAYWFGKPNVWSMAEDEVARRIKVGKDQGRSSRAESSSHPQ